MAHATLSNAWQQFGPLGTKPHVTAAFCFYVQEGFPSVWGLSAWTFSSYSESIICHQLRLIIVFYHSTWTRQPREILPALLLFLFSPIKRSISSDDVKSLSEAKIAVNTLSPFSRMKSEY